MAFGLQSRRIEPIGALLSAGLCSFAQGLRSLHNCALFLLWSWQFYSSEFIVKSTLNHLVNGLYMRILDNFDNWCSNLDKCMQEIMAAHSFGDPNGASEKWMGVQVISSLAVVLFE